MEVSYVCILHVIALVIVGKSILAWLTSCFAVWAPSMCEQRERVYLTKQRHSTLYEGSDRVAVLWENLHFASVFRFIFNYPIQCSNNIFLSDIHVCNVRARVLRQLKTKRIYAWAGGLSSLMWKICHCILGIPHWKLATLSKWVCARFLTVASSPPSPLSAITQPES